MDRLPTILVTGVVPRLDRLRELGRVKRAGWTAVARESAGPGVALTILGSAPANVDTRAVMAELRRETSKAAVPLLHLAEHGSTCEGCRADVCLPAVTRPETLVGITRTLLTLGRKPPPASRVRATDPAQASPPAQEASSSLGKGVQAAAVLERATHRGASGLLLGLLEAVPGIVFLYDREERRFTYLSPAVEDVLGYGPAELMAMSPAAPLSLVQPEDQARLAAGVAAVVNGTAFETELRARARDGAWHTLRSRAVALGPGDERAGPLLGVATDVTAERESRRMLEHAQRLEAFGHMAGGIAHDFNNLLGVITGHSQLAQRLLPREHPASSGIDQVIKASERAAALAQQLLSLSRGQSRGPQSLDLNVLVSGVAAMLQRVIAEDVEFDVRQGAALGPVKADAGEIEQVLLNLALNARDAMPLGGRLRIETRNAEIGEEEAALVGLRTGRYVVLTVADTGSGMDAETRARIFEPFFTTKAEGRGSGLGLATVHGIVERCFGAIRVESTPGAGTSFHVYLPREDLAARPVGPVPPTRGTLGGGETILLVEDADPVRDVTRDLLEGLGYTVLAAAHGAQALALARAYPGPIHLLLTDVVMPHLGGDTLAAQVAVLRPQIRVLYMSGYAGDALPPDAVLLQKPFTRDRLARAIRDTIDRS